MPHIIIAAAGALTLYYALRWVRRESDRVEATFRKTHRRIRKAQTGAPLAYDQATGVYRPVE
jgi:hypothetical protein